VLLVLQVVDGDGAAQNVMYVGPTAGTRTNHNPTVRLFYLDADTLELLDFDNYYLDLNEARGTMLAPEINGRAPSRMQGYID
jgi:hypothetical protein